MQTQRFLALVPLCLAAVGAGADVFVEVHFTGQAPDTMTNADLEIGATADLSVSVWSDTPGIAVASISMALNGRSALGVLDSGGVVSFSQLGQADPGGVFDASDDGLLGPGTPESITTISAISMGVLNPALGVTLPTSAASALVIYEGFEGTALEFGSGVLPEVFIQPALGTPTQAVRTFGLYQVPAPSGAALLGIAALGAARRRR